MPIKTSMMKTIAIAMTLQPSRCEARHV